MNSQTTSNLDIDSKAQHWVKSSDLSIEKQTAKLPSDLLLWLAMGSIAFSLVCKARGKSETANFVGHWAPTFLCLGLYTKLVKLESSDKR